MAKDHELKLAQMKEFIQQLGSSVEKYGDPTLERFLIATSMDPNKAANMFVSWQKWRTSFVPLGFIPDSEVVQQLEPRKIFLQGLCNSGHPLMILNASKHYPAKDQHQFKKFVVHVLDKGIASAIRGNEIGNEKIVVIIDLQQAYYPERLAKLYMLNMPRFFVSVWKMISYFLEKATLHKIMIVTSEEERKHFVTEVGKEVLPEVFGGEAKFVALQDVEAPRLESRLTF
ncbi:SEC14 cytosolic factor-like isoform X7 [Cynara cardunculus var. scolymus]|uniref:SEC14 cytosolic factor-like isoform X7 n=1 Tax=Cynara cardunculus var. scolymus TaxID=59895 RepID=UPI000D624B5D|nr:SEC14 cytosolic factor-like isoform X7 [Cynara cardunculus var. scolymus]